MPGGIVHRDLKPGNIWLSSDGLAKLGDFGLAVALDRSRLTREGMMVGTASYMAPEQALGGDVTARSDLYALGCSLYEMVTGRPPFLGDDTVAVISQHINTAPIAPSWHNPEVPRSLEVLMLRLLSKSPEDRPESAGAVAEELRRISEQPAEQPTAPTPGPSELLGVTWGQFVGRREEMNQLKGALENTLSGRGSLVMLVGEPGIGKTRLAEEFAVYARLRGAQVLTGRCYEGEVALPYRPFVEAFLQYVRARPDPLLRQEMGEGAPEIAKLVSEVRQRFPDVRAAPPLEADAERLRLLESVSSFVHNAAAASPLLLFLDDLHWVDKPSLLMLRYLARAVAGDRVLLVGAYRDVELDRSHPLAEVIATLRREQPYQRILLRGLPQDDVLALLTAIEPSEEAAQGRQVLAAALHQETEGNPFFIREVLSHLVEEGKIVHEGGLWTTKVQAVSELGIPEGVREVVGRRLSRLSGGCNHMLGLASTMTGGFSWEELKAITAESEPALLDSLDEALAAQLIHERKGEQAGIYDFTHALIRQTLYGELSTPRRVLLHRQIGQALEELHAANLEPHLAELAHHFFQAAPGGDVDKAIDYATRAGDRAVELLAYEEAAAHYNLALQALDLKDRPDERQRYDLLLAAGQAYSRADVPDPAMALLEHAVQLAERLGDSELQGEAALAYADAVGRSSLVLSGQAAPVLERALEAQGEEDSNLRTVLLAQLSHSLPPHTLWEQRLELARKAVEVADRVGQPLARARALEALHLSLPGPESAEERLAIADQCVRAAEGAKDRPRILSAHFLMMADLAELGDVLEVDHEIAFISNLADQMREPMYGTWRPFWGAMRDLMQGKYEEAERLILQNAPLAQRIQHPVFVQSLGAQFFDLRWAQGRLGELESIVKRNAEENPLVPVWRAALAFLYSETDRPEEARRCFDDLAANDFADVPRDFNFLILLGSAAIQARRLNDRPRAATIYDLLRPYADRQLTTGSAAMCTGSASLSLGILAATMGRWDDAERHFEDALAFNEKIGARPWLARAQRDYADMLRERDEPGDREKALALVNKALATFEELDMPKDLEYALQLKVQLQGISSTDVRTSIDAVAAYVQAERPDLGTHAAPDGTVTILFTDIEGSTALNERLGDQRWVELLRVHNAIVRDHVLANGGFEVKNQGDGFMVAFGSARNAVQCGIALQRAFADHSRVADEPVHVRIGLHTGEAIREAGDFYGRHVTLASRIADQAAGGEILVSSLLKELTESAGAFAFGAEREVALKGLTGTQRVFAVAWQ